jgi:hypothetical protein
VNAKQPEEFLPFVGAFLLLVPVEFLPGETYLSASRGMALNIGRNNFLRSFYINGGIPFTSDFDRMTQHRDVNGLFGSQYTGMRPTTYFGQHQGRRITLTNLFKSTYSPPESTYQNQQKSRSPHWDLTNLHQSHDTTMRQTTYFGKRQENRIDERDFLRHPNYH